MQSCFYLSRWGFCELIAAWSEPGLILSSLPVEHNKLTIYAYTNPVFNILGAREDQVSIAAL